MWLGARTSSPASIAASEPLPAAFRSTARSSGSSCSRSPKAPAAPPRSYGQRRRSGRLLPLAPFLFFHRRLLDLIKLLETDQVLDLLARGDVLLGSHGGILAGAL